MQFDRDVEEKEENEEEGPERLMVEIPPELKYGGRSLGTSLAIS